MLCKGEINTKVILPLAKMFITTIYKVSTVENNRFYRRIRRLSVIKTEEILIGVNNISILNKLVRVNNKIK